MIHLKVFENFDEIEIYINDIFEDLKDIGYSIRINKNRSNYNIDIFRQYNSIGVNQGNYDIDIVGDYILTLESYMKSMKYKLHNTIINYTNNRKSTFLTTKGEEYLEPAKHVCNRVKLITNNDKSIINNILLSFYK